MKPHLYKEHGLWYCVHPIYKGIGFGRSMERAYQDWWFTNIEEFEV